MMIIIGILVFLSGAAGITATLFFSFNPFLSANPVPDILFAEITLAIVGISLILLGVLHRTKR